MFHSVCWFSTTFGHGGVGQPSKITKAHYVNAGQLPVSLGSGLIGLTAEVKNQMACAFKRKTWVTACGGGCAKNVERMLMKNANTSEEAQPKEKKLCSLTWYPGFPLDDT